MTTKTLRQDTELHGATHRGGQRVLRHLSIMTGSRTPLWFSSVLSVSSVVKILAGTTKHHAKPLCSGVLRAMMPHPSARA